MVVRNFFTLYVLANQTPTGGKSQNASLGRPLALPGAGPKTEKCNFPVLGALLEGKSGRPESCSLEVRNFFTFYVLADRTPTGEKSRKSTVIAQGQTVGSPRQ